MRMLIRFLLLVCFLSLGGYVQACPTCLYHATEKVCHRAANEIHCSGSRSEEEQLSRTPLPGTRKADHKIKAVEIQEDDESDSNKKNQGAEYTSFSSYSGDIHQHLTSRLPFCKHFSYSSAQKFIINRVIRI